MGASESQSIDPLARRGSSVVPPPEREFTEIFAKFDSLMLNNCADEMVAITSCLNDLAANADSGKRDDAQATSPSGACAQQMKTLKRCHQNREKLQGTVRAGCGGFYDKYETCMMSNGSQPQLCIKNLDALYQCAEQVLEK